MKLILLSYKQVKKKKKRKSSKEKVYQIFQNEKKWDSFIPLAVNWN